jgi:hypothetical protein
MRGMLGSLVILPLNYHRDRFSLYSFHLQYQFNVARSHEGQLEDTNGSHGTTQRRRDELHLIIVNDTLVKTSRCLQLTSKSHYGFQSVSVID